MQFLGKGVLKICSKFTGENPCRSVVSIKLLCNFIKITLRHGCSPVNLLLIFRTTFPRNTSGWLLLIFSSEHIICGGVFRTQLIIYDGTFLRKKLITFGKKLHHMFHQMFNWILNKPLTLKTWYKSPAPSIIIDYWKR